MEPIEEIRSWWEVPSVAHFCSLFRAAFDLPDFDIEDLEEALLVSKHVDSPFLQDLLCRLMNGCYGRDDICSYNCDLFLKDLVKYKWKHEGNEGESPLAGKSFNMLTSREKVEVLHSFCDSRLDAEDVMELLKGLEGENMRVEPLGKDGEGALYWYFYGSRLYKEDPEPVVEEEPKEKKKRGKKQNNAEQETKKGNKKELQKKKQKQLVKKKKKKEKKMEEKRETNARRSGRLAKKEEDEDSECSNSEEENIDKKTLRGRRGRKKEAEKTMKSKDEPKEDTNGNVRRSGRIAKREEEMEEDSEGTDDYEEEEENEGKMVKDKKPHTKRKIRSIKNNDAKFEAEEDKKKGLFRQLDRNEEEMETTQEQSGCSEEKDEKTSFKYENVKTNNNGDKGQMKIEEPIKAESVTNEHMEVNENHKENDVEREDTAKVIEDKMAVVNDNKQEIKKEIMPEMKKVETSGPHPSPSRWHLICEALQDWIDLAEKFKGSTVRSERSLAKAIQEDFLPVLPEIIENREKEKRRRLLEQAPRRLSNRIEAKKKEQEEQERIVEEARAEEEKARQKFLEEQRKKQEEERIEEERKLREERLKAREERSKRLQLREERARLMAEGKEIPEELWNHGTRNKYKDGYDSEDSRSDTLGEDEIAGMIKVVEAVKANKDAWPFLEPVTDEQAPGYHDVIKRPMDLSKIEAKANRREYKSRKQFFNDFSLMFNNCRRFNGPKSDFTQMARSVERSLGKYFKKYLSNDIPDYVDDDDYVGKDMGSANRRFRPQRAASSKGLQTIHRALRDNDDSSNSEEDRSPSPLRRPVKLWAQRDIETEEHIKNILRKEDSPAKRLQAMIQAKRNNQPFIYPRKTETTLDNDNVVIRPKPNVLNKKPQDPQEGVMIIPKEELPTDGVLRLAATREIRWKPSGIFNGARQEGKSFSIQKSSNSNFPPFYLSKDKQPLSSETSTNSVVLNSGSSTNQHPLTHVMPHLVAKHGQSGGTVQVKSFTPTTSPITGNKIITIVTSGQGQTALGSTVPGVQLSEDGYLVINGQKTEIKGTGKIKVVFQQPKTSPASVSPGVSTPQHTSAIAGLNKLQIGRVAHSTVNSPEIQSMATTLIPNPNLPRISQNSGDTDQQQPGGPFKDPRLGVSKISPVINTVYSVPTGPIQKQEPKGEEKVRIPFRISDTKVKTLQPSDTLTFDFETQPRNHRKEESIESYLLKKRKVTGISDDAFTPKQPRPDSDSLNMQTSPPSLLELQSCNRVENNNADPVFSSVPCTLANSNKPITSMTDTLVQSVNITSDILSSYYSVFNSSKGESKVNDQIPPLKLDTVKSNLTNLQEVRATIPQKIGETRKNIQSLPVSLKPQRSIVHRDMSDMVSNIHPGHSLGNKSEIHHYNISKSGICEQEKLSSTLSINVSDKISPAKAMMNHCDLSPGKNRLSLFDVFADQSTTRKEMEDTNNLPLQSPVRNSPIKSQNLLSALKSKLSASVASKTAAESEQANKTPVDDLKTASFKN
ncbi:hypothetical protein CHS0354_034227 [Potamilus streckersoni]|uniref:Bromo domain-containing protein n=1 Tax=Potamilus streckersoni TaxID=2493646 RepID=A0AAE0T2I8_9BIVA|nr:hypothetical protein CHS0354_034227 [Potamilus streckersoni]